MKRIISLVLCLVMCLTIVSATALPTVAVGLAKEIFTVTHGEYEGDLITYTIKLNASQKKVTGFVLNAVYDASALTVESCVPVGIVDVDGEVVPDIEGIYESGAVYNKTGVYSMAYLSPNGYDVGTAAEGIYKITFRAISKDRLWSSVKFNCVEYITDDSNDNNDIQKTEAAQEFYSHSFHTLSVPNVTEVNSYQNALKVVWNAEDGAENYYVYRVKSDDFYAAFENSVAVPWELIGPAEGVGNVNFYIDNAAVKGTEYYYTVSAENAGGKTAYDPYGLEGMNFGSIENITVTEAAGGKGAAISWSKLDGADYYEIYRKLGSADESSWQLLNKTSATSFTDGSVGSGVVYNYKVRAFQQDGKYSADMICDVPSFMYIAVPVTTVENTFDGIEISFIPSFGATKFVIEKKVGNGNFSVMSTIDVEDFTEENIVVFDADVTPGETYTYTIQAFSADLSSAEKELAPVKRLGKTQITSIENNTSGVSLSWNAVAEADSYAIYRKTTAESAEFKKITSTADTSYVDISARSGYKYVYSVVAANETGHGDYADEDKVIMYLNAPIIESIATTNDGIKLEWYAVSGAESYNIYRKSGNDAWSVYKTGITDTSFTDLRSDVAHGVEYSYSVEATAEGYISGKDDNGAQGMHFGVIESINAIATSNGAKITWNLLPEAKAYNVYRKTTSETTWGSPIATVTVNSYEDKNMQSGVSYEYKVNGINGNSIAGMVCQPAGIMVLDKPTATAKNIAKGIELRITKKVDGADKYIFQKLVDGKYVDIATVLAGDKLVYVDEDVSPKVTYTYKAYAVAEADGTVPQVESPAYSISSVKRIGAPTITKIENTLAGINLEWEEIENVDSYQLLRKSEYDDEWVCIDYELYENYYLDLDIDSGVKYYYTVNAVTEDGGLSGYDENGKGITFLETPDLGAVKNASGGIQFTWYAVDGAAKYTIYRRESSSWVNVGTVTGTKFTDKTATYGKTYRYTVRAVAEDGARSYFDTSGLKLKSTVPGPVKVTLSNYSSGVQIKWSKVTGAKNYIVYRKSGSSWKALKTVSSSTTSYKDTAVKNSGGKTYTYTVRAVNGKMASPFSEYKIVRLYAPKVSLSNYNSGIKISWGKVSGAKNYTIYRKSGSSWKALKTVSSSTTTYYDSAVNKKGGTTYTYTVKATNGSSASTFGSFSYKRLYTPTLTSAKSSKTGITVAWKPVSSTSGYYIYRKEGSGSYKKIATVKGSKSSKYVDKSAKKGKTYTYTVKAYSGSSVSYYNTTGLKCKDKY